MKLTPAELFDALSIVAIKYAMLEQTLTRRSGKTQMVQDTLTELRHSMLESVYKITDETDPRLHPIVQDMLGLAGTNLEIFQAVDTVASAEDDRIAAEAGRKAQTLNLHRSNLKKAIDEFFEGWSKEVKI